MSRELRFVLILFGSIFGLCIVAGIAAIFVIGGVISKAEHSETPQSRSRIAERIAPVPAGYRVVAATDLFYSLSVTLRSSNGMEIQLQSNTAPGAAAVSVNNQQLTRDFVGKTMQLMAGHCSPSTDRLLVKGRTVELDALTCAMRGSESLKLEYGQFQGRSGPTTIIASSSPDAWDPRALREILGDAR